MGCPHPSCAGSLSSQRARHLFPSLRDPSSVADVRLLENLGLTCVVQFCFLLLALWVKPHPCSSTSARAGATSPIHSCCPSPGAPAPGETALFHIPGLVLSLPRTCSDGVFSHRGKLGRLSSGLWNCRCLTVGRVRKCGQRCALPGLGGERGPESLVWPPCTHPRAPPESAGVPMDPAAPLPSGTAAPDLELDKGWEGHSGGPASGSRDYRLPDPRPISTPPR